MQELKGIKEYCYNTIEIYENEGKDLTPIRVLKGHYFVIGDNRDNSRDSRFLGICS